MGYDISILLDKDFAGEMMGANISTERQDKMNELANETLKRFGESWKDPYKFHDSTCLVKQFYLGHNGVWLSENESDLQNLNLDKLNHPYVKYSPHNMRNSKDSFILMFLFGEWVKYSDALKKA